MKPKVNRGNNIRGLLSYALGVGSGAGPNKEAEIVGGNMSGSNVDELTREFSAIQSLRPDIVRPVWHCSLALPAGERMSGAKWSEVVTAFMAGMNFDPKTIGHVAIRHKDTDFDHVHIAASRIGLDGSVWAGRHEAFRAITTAQSLEKKFGLTLTPGLIGMRPDIAPPTNGEFNSQKRSGEVPLRVQLQAILDQAASDGPTMSAFVKRLQAQNVGLRVNLDKRGEVNGISFELDGVPFKGSGLGKNYSWPGLQKRGVSYDPARDDAELLRFRHPAVVDTKVGANIDVITVEESPNLGTQTSVSCVEEAATKVESPSVTVIETIKSAVVDNGVGKETASIYVQESKTTENIRIEIGRNLDGLASRFDAEEGGSNNSSKGDETVVNALLIPSSETEMLAATDAGLTISQPIVLPNQKTLSERLARIATSVDKQATTENSIKGPSPS